ncbi:MULTISPECIES: NPCBM/NEW2 domain-containing protein [Chryseobacterium]|uniref:Alpha-galactosidase n=1 Tax=Chryseobacterium camelliae TaxID=1265445 RepID=A0ABU0TG82_9FLAO|nr:MULTISPECIES: NPCBM/NEW2 domain-containing protein [Chryseobacterium]MDT3406126.1 alpha-galactosidase [Pseudacidovorax intermedius]MDQ1096070.1 alpha-galactosidase [Chryseobacterium camelliae]MDQ1100008.1 alpha-galactosidase [Chryseobacterium sp. SORGH_AS_1048]MDR6087352.1 alpha-galactosidase [Chryseobacterium sp. SORGH_AS_0909]MDR6131727.1 alpha-galactosidase [Chryseobacterium sp. SORGH_AS_1175]
MFRFKLFVLSFLIAGCYLNAQSTVWLDKLDLSVATQGNGKPGINTSVDGKKLTIAGKTFDRGFGTHAESSLLIKLNGKAKSFSALVGLDDEMKGQNPAVEFEIYGDNKKLWSSGVMHLGDKAKPVSVLLEGVKQLELVVADGGNGPYYDHADWADAKFETSEGAQLITFNPISSVPYILTPKPAATPKINSAGVYGVRPGSPFLFRIAATGDRPMTFTAKNLPKGLTIDSKTGIITGKIDTKATYEVLLSAKNAKGSVSKKIRIESGDKIALTPTMGWNSWNCFGHEVSADKVKRAADALVKTGLINHGWNYINIDDSWQFNRDGKDPFFKGQFRDNDGYILTNSKFPDMKELTDYFHSIGLKAGIYSSPGPWTCGGCAGSYGYEKQDAESYAKWGIDYLKYDWCSYGGVIDGLPDNDPNKVSSLNFQGGGDLDKGVKPFKLMGNLLKNQPRDIVYNLCQYGMGDVWKWGNDADAQSWRTTNDITDTWASVKNIALAQDKAAPYAKPGNWNDPDMLVVGVVGWGNPHQSRLKPDEQYLHISLWSIFSAPLLIGCDLEKLDDFTLNLLTNDEVIAVNQDALGKQGVCLQTIGELKIYVKDLEDGGKAVAFANFGMEKVNMSYKDFRQLRISGRQTVRDIWRQQDIAKINTSNQALSLDIPAHGVAYYKFISSK